MVQGLSGSPLRVCRGLGPLRSIPKRRRRSTPEKLSGRCYGRSSGAKRLRPGLAVVRGARGKGGAGGREGRGRGLVGGTLKGRGHFGGDPGRLWPPPKWPGHGGRVKVRAS